MNDPKDEDFEKILTHFKRLFHLYNFWKLQTTFSFLTFSGSELQHGFKIATLVDLHLDFLLYVENLVYFN